MRRCASCFQRHVSFLNIRAESVQFWNDSESLGRRSSKTIGLCVSNKIFCITDSHRLHGAAKLGCQYDSEEVCMSRIRHVERSVDTRTFCTTAEYVLIPRARVSASSGSSWQI